MRLLFIHEDADYTADLLPDIEQDYVVDVAFSGAQGTELSQINDYDVLVVSASLSDMTSSSVCENARQAKIEGPIIVVAPSDPSNVSPSTKIACLDSGADVFCTLPANSRELNAQVRALVRRHSLSTSLSDIICIGAVVIDLKTRQVCVYGHTIKLSRKEYDILQYLMLNKNKIVSKEELLEHVWLRGIYILSNTVEAHIGYLRKKIDKPFKIKFIKTIRGFGYTVGSVYD
jgi:DNA-binding response OmpR family regulator